MLAKQRTICTCVISLVCGSLGCAPPKFYDCEGVVTHEGRPVANLQITFTPDIIDSVRMPLGLTNSEGRFEMFSGRHMGVPPGGYSVYVEDPGAADGRQTSKEADYLYVIDRYSPDKSDLKYVADRDRIDFELKLDIKEYIAPVVEDPVVEDPESKKAVAAPENPDVAAVPPEGTPAE